MRLQTPFSLALRSRILTSKPARGTALNQELAPESDVGLALGLHQNSTRYLSRKVFDVDSLTSLQAFGWEFFGTTLLLLFGNGVCAVNNLRTSAGHNSGWLLITFGWGFAVYIGASVADPTGGHLNPAVTIFLAIQGSTPWSLVPFYLAGQLLGAIAGAVLCWAAFKQLFDAHDDNAHSGGCFFTIPAHPNKFWNGVTEFIATFALLAFIGFGPAGGEISNLKYFGVAIIIVAIGMSLGSPTGYAINPVRDFGPRLAYAFLLPIPGKGSAHWDYALVPIVAPLLAACAAGGLAVLI